MTLKEIAYALRRLAKAPGFSLTTVLTLALGIGASTAVFTLVDSVLLKPLRYRDSGRLVAVWERVRFLSSDLTGPNPRHFDLWQKQTTAFTGLTLVRSGAAGLALGNEHPRLVGVVTSHAYLFDVLQVSPLLGRTFRAEDCVRGHDDVAILTYRLWRNEFAGDANVIGKTVRLADTPREVIGVLPANFAFPNGNALRAFSSRQSASSVPEPTIFIPAAVNLNNFSWGGEHGNWVALGRLKSGMGIAQAESQLNGIEAQVAADHLHLRWPELF